MAGAAPGAGDTGSGAAAPVSPDERRLLLDLAVDAIWARLSGHRPAGPAADEVPPRLRVAQGVFVTVTVDGRLNGCIGALHSDRPLFEEVPRLAVQAAFSDPRLPPLDRREWPRASVEISLLGPLEPIAAGSRAELLAALRPGVDGLVLGVGGRQATFLPVVWESLPDADDFVDHLLRKAGLPVRGWPAAMRALRYSAEKIAAPPGPATR